MMNKMNASIKLDYHGNEVSKLMKYDNDDDY